MLTKEDADAAMKALDNWYDPCNDKDVVAGFIEDARDLLPTFKEAVAQIKREYSSVFVEPVLTQDQIRAIGDAWSRK